MLVIAPCRSACDWAGPDTQESPQKSPPLWSCAGCGSQWQPGEPWAPRQLDGSWPPGVREALDGT